MYSIIPHPILPEEKALAANKEILPEYTVFFVHNLPRTETNNRHAITISAGNYLDTTSTDIMYLNHSCDPNLKFDSENLVFISTRSILVGEILCFDYTLTEIEISSPFYCICGSSPCKGRID